MKGGDWEADVVSTLKGDFGRQLSEPFDLPACLKNSQQRKPGINNAKNATINF